MLTTVVLLLLSAGVIYLSCEFFVNGVEWVGRRAGVAQKAVGTILAAFGTALPESVVTFVAVVFGTNEAAKNIGVGAALGGPLVLSTVSYAVVGLMLLLTAGRARIAALADTDGHLARDQGWFLIIFALKVGLGLVAFSIKPWLGWLFLAAYAAYFWVEMRQEGTPHEGEELGPLKFRPRDPAPPLTWALVQTVLALVLIFGASHVFVTQLEHIGPWLGIPPAIVALLLSPIATELPETMNAIIWVRQGKTGLALANISGAMMIQATVPSALGIGFTPWMFDRALILAAVVTMISISGLWLLLRRRALTSLRLMLFGLLYGVFAAGLAFVGFSH
ncbi:MAG: sodium:calcium antiporter [Rudaea sp.]|uniref:sodium:calcium antiporter n=1 Tax=unclassified Rudaea TaxID=2627037 RepID=UPI0010F970FA|nr:MULTISPECIES: sodium:calcium antiporter [unclassified Rudaea]MBN8885099.1 sodium:calcium antiporter [Rudaea sp.]MBR0344778.1 sodium:calcium antiporter [Rudaea sp.]